MNGGQKSIEIYKNELKRLRKAGDRTALIAKLAACATLAHAWLESLEKIELKSMVAPKKYFSFDQRPKLSRAVNSELFLLQPLEIRQVRDFLECPSQSMPFEATKLAYTIAMSFFCVVDIIKERDQASPGNYFEILNYCLLGQMLGVNPIGRIPVLNLETEEYLTTDMIFDLGANKPKFHVPVKASTRERMVQLYAHQRILDSVYGTGRFLGFPIIMAETKKDTKKLEVTEICLPQQWRLYQRYIARMWSVCYYDIPIVYEALNLEFPPITVRTIGEYIGKSGIIDSAKNSGWETLRP